MADGSDDPTTATPVGHTQPMPPPAPDQGPGSGRPSGWRAGQVAVVAVLALLLGGAGATLAWLAADRGEQEPTDAAVAPTTSTTSADADRSTSSTTTTSSVSTTTTTRRSGGGNQSGGQTVVGNGVFTGSYQGNNNRSTDDFTVDDDWTIRWDVPEGAITIDVFDAADEVVESIQAQGQGELAVNEGGTYRLDIRTDGSRYNVAVTDGP